MSGLENRYVVLKKKDIDEVLSVAEQNQLDDLCRKINLHRGRMGRDGLQCVVVEHDWPEFQPVCDAIKARAGLG